MTEIRNYFETEQKIERSNFKIELYKDDAEFLYKESLINNELKQQLQTICDRISEHDPKADNIRHGFLHILDSFLEIFNEITLVHKRFPDLSQFMIIPGYLLTMIVYDMRTSLETEGSYSPVSNVIETSKEWDYTKLIEIISLSREQLNHITFASKLEAINHFYGVRERIFELHKSLMNEGIISPYH